MNCDSGLLSSDDGLPAYQAGAVEGWIGDEFIIFDDVPDDEPPSRKMIPALMDISFKKTDDTKAVEEDFEGGWKARKGATLQLVLSSKTELKGKLEISMHYGNPSVDRPVEIQDWDERKKAVDDLQSLAVFSITNTCAQYKPVKWRRNSLSQPIVASIDDIRCKGEEGEGDDLFVRFISVSSIQKRGMGWVMEVKIKDEQDNVVGQGSANLKVLKILRDLKRKRQRQDSDDSMYHSSPASNVSDNDLDIESMTVSKMVQLHKSNRQEIKAKEQINDLITAELAKRSIQILP